MLQAAEFWAEARDGGFASTGDKDLDGDVILAAQAVALERDGFEVIVITTNVKHLQHFTAAERWDELSWLSELPDI